MLQPKRVDQKSAFDQIDARHSSVLFIDLESLKKNYNLLKEKAASSVVAPVVKANAYGLGIMPIAKKLEALGAKEFFVAQLEEGIELRQILPNVQIYILYGFVLSQAKEFKAFSLVPVLNTIEQVRDWCDSSLPTQPAICHFDTGLNRLGIPIDQVDLIRKLADQKTLNIQYIMSHLACSEDQSHPKNGDQLRNFQKIRHSFPGIKASFSNSGGCFLEPAFHFDLVRTGIALYGGNPTIDEKNSMHPVISLYARLLQIKEVKKGETIGYGASFTADKKMRIGILAYGYADGYLRAASNIGHAYHKGHYLKILGRISMDLMAIDLSPFNENEIHENIWVELIGEHCSLDKIAETMGTISYEVLTSLKQRVFRLYMNE